MNFFIKPYWILVITYMVLFFKDRKLLTRLKPRYDNYTRNPLLLSAIIMITGSMTFRYLQIQSKQEDEVFLILFLIYVNCLGLLYGVLINKGINEASYRQKLFNLYGKYVVYSFLGIVLISIIYFIF
jgi:hypothetical protein